MKIIGVNGIYVPYSKNRSTDRLLSLLKDKYEVYDFNYNEVFVWMTIGYGHTTRLAKQLMEISSPDDIVFGHSYGAAIINEAVNLGAKFKAIVLFSGACEEDVRWPERCAHQIINVYNPKDWILKLGEILPCSVLGDYGRDVRDHVLNINADEVHEVKTWYCHNDYFRDENIEFWENLLTDICEEELQWADSLL